MEYHFGIINNIVLSKFKEISNQTVLSRLRQAVRKLLKFCLIRDQLFHFIKIVKFVDNDNTVTFVGLCYDDAIIFTQIFRATYSSY